jgi:transcriptional regulator with XRE-family HTH domain
VHNLNVLKEGENIKLLLLLSGTSEAEIARNLGLNRASISMVVTGKSKSRRVREAIAIALDAKVTDLWPEERKKN